jgi:hypothetical protein
VDSARPLRAWLDDARAGAVDPEAVAELRRQLTAPGGSDLVSRAPGGGLICWRRLGHGRRRRLLELDRSGNAVSLLRWTAHGALREAWIRIPPAGFVGIEAGPDPAGPPGRDRLVFARAPAERQAARTLGDFTALDYGAVRDIPVLAEPARLPPHAGTAVLNLLAALAADAAGAAHHPLRYRGPYPTEALFLALLESFHYTPEVDDPLAAFLHGRLGWLPAPHGRWFTPDGAYVQLRGRVEKVVWRGRAYYRPDWQRTARHTPRRVHDDAGGVRCSLWVLGRPIETPLALDPDGRVRDVPVPAPCPSPVRAFDGTVTRGVESVVLAQSAPALGPALRDVTRTLALEWGPVEGDLVTAISDRLRVSTRLRDTVATAVRAAGTREARLALALAALVEIAALIGDTLRARAQTHLLARLESEQAHALAASPEPPSAEAIAAAAEALEAELFRMT